MLNSFFTKVLSILMSVWLAIAGFFGFSDIPKQVEPEEKQIKNVIYLIGDGMGFNHLEKAKNDLNITLIMDSFEIKGSSRTASLSSSITDSAAGGTALSTGSRTGNEMIGVYYTDKYANTSYPKNITELCKENGKMVGIITTDLTSGATPAAFSAHSSNRTNTIDITSDQLTSDIDLIWGMGNGIVTKSSAEANGYEYVATYNDMISLSEGSKSFAQFTNTLWKTVQVDKNNPNLEQMAIKAVDILDDTEEGFFLMIEGAHIDAHSHNNDGKNMVEALVEFDKTINAMLKYAQEDGETLVVVTADHETGGIIVKDGSYTFTSNGHSAANVPIFIYGSDKIIYSGETLDNNQIPIRIARVLGFDETVFPVSIYT